MIIIGEKINTSRAEVADAVTRQDAAFIRQLARRQTDAGARYVDVNCGTFGSDEPEILKWMVAEVQEELEGAPLCIDSRNPEAVNSALEMHQGCALVNSISGEAKRYDSMVPLVASYHAKVVVLSMDDESGIPAKAQTRFKIASRLIEDLKKQGIGNEDVYIDPLIQPISVDTKNGLAAAETIRLVRDKFPAAHAVCGLSNVSFELPERKLLNQAYMVICAAYGLDTVIMNPEDREMMRLVYASDALLDRDTYCKGYLTAYREGHLDLI